MSNEQGSVSVDDFDECWCCGGLHDAVGSLCPDCDDAGCQHFGGECQSDHQPVLPDGGESEQQTGQCDYGGCENPGYSTITHEGKHTFCLYHYERVNP